MSLLSGLTDPVNNYFKSIPTYMDYEGQRLAEKLFQGIILVFAFAGLVWGYAVEQFSYTVITLAVGFVLSCLITLPAWPMYRRKPLKWQKSRSSGESTKSKKK